MTREKNCSAITTGKASLKTSAGQMDRHADFLFQSYLEEEAKGWATPMLQQQEIDAMFPDEWCPTPAFSIEQASCNRGASTPRQA